MKEIRNVIFIMLFQFVCAGIVCAADESGPVQPSTTEKYQKVRELIEGLVNLPAGKGAPEVVVQANKSIAAAQEGLKSGSDKMTREYTEMAALQVTLATALAEERDAAATVENTRKLLVSHENRLTAILSGKGDK